MFNVFLNYTVFILLYDIIQRHGLLMPKYIETM